MYIHHVVDNVFAVLVRDLVVLEKKMAQLFTNLSGQEIVEFLVC